MTTLNSQRELDLLRELTPEKRKELSSKMAEMRMAEMDSNIAAAEADAVRGSNKKPRTVTTSNRISDVDESVLTDCQGDTTDKSMAEKPIPVHLAQCENEGDTLVRTANNEFLKLSECEKRQCLDLLKQKKMC